MLEITKSAIARILLMSTLAALGALLCVAPPSVAQSVAKSDPAKKDAKARYRIGFHLWQRGKIYDEAMAGIKDGLKLAHLDYEEVVLLSNQDNARTTDDLKKLDAMRLDLIYTLSSAGTQIAMGLDLKTPVISTVINHPASLGVGQTDRTGTTRLTGTSYYVESEKQLKLYLSLFPKVKKVGMIYDRKNPAGSLAEEPFMRKACKARGFAFVSAAVERKDQLAEAARTLLADGVDIIVIPTNRLVYENLGMVLALTHEKRIPVVSLNKQGVEYGALAGLYADTYNLGRDTAPMAKKILTKKTDPREIPFGYIAQPDLIVNLKEASALGYEFPSQILGQATIVLQ